MTQSPPQWTLREVRIRASLLLKSARAGDPAAIEALGGVLKRRRALNVAAQTLTGSTYDTFRARAEGGPAPGRADPARFFDCGVSSFLNHWFASRSEAAAFRQANGGTLFPYRRQFVVVEAHFLRAVGLDPDDPDWQAIGHDFTRPADGPAFERLNAKLCEAGFARQEDADAR